MVNDTRQRTDEIIGTQLQSLRAFADLSLEEAAATLGISPRELSSFEAGATRPSPQIILAMAECYDVAPSRVFDTVEASQRL